MGMSVMISEMSLDWVCVAESILTWTKSELGEGGLSFFSLSLLLSLVP